MTNDKLRGESVAELIAQRLHRLAAVGKLATEADLAELRQMMEEEQGEFVEWVESRLYPNPVAACGENALRYLRVCLLVRLGGEPYEMINLLGISPTNLCRSAMPLRLRRISGGDCSSGCSG